MNNSGADEIGKLFVGGLDWSTTQETLRSYFSQYGEVVDCVIMKDKTTNQSRGFGFVKFKDPNCVGTVLASRPHTLDGRNIDPKPCTPRGMQPERTRPKEGWQKGPRSDNSKSNKIFVGGIPHNCGETELREYFKKFGVVTEVVMIYDAEKQRPRGFGFITFEDEQSVDQAVNMHFHDIMGKKVEVKRAEPRDSKSQAPGQPGASQWGSRIRPARNVGAGRTGDWWLWTAPCRKRSPPATPTVHLLHRIHPSWRLSPSPGLPSGLWCPATVQFWLRASTSTTRSVCPSGGSSSTGHPRGSTSGFPTASISGRPGHEQAPDSSARLPLWSVCRLRAGLEWLWTGLLGPQPAASLLRGPLRARVRGPPPVAAALDEGRTTTCKGSTPTDASPRRRDACTADPGFQTWELVTITNVAAK
uniref:DAZ-associated protein 1 n=1 Tax=Macaca fascicularis TaxID=9541 RepID=A0A7N9DDI3_MACFA